MRIAYLDCFAGICGDMTLGALADAGVPRAELAQAIRRLKLSGVSLAFREEERHGLTGTRCVVRLPRRVPRYSAAGMIRVIQRSSLPRVVARQAAQMVRRLATVERGIHGEDHFDQLGDADTIVDLVGAAFGFHRLGVERIYVSPIRLGRGMVHCHGGKLPIPGPATLALLKGFAVDLTPIPVELTTPTGAVIASTLARPVDRIPPMRIERVGCGVGGYRLRELPDLLRIVIGETK